MSEIRAIGRDYWMTRIRLSEVVIDDED